MLDVLAAILLGVCALGGLALIPLGLPGLWVMVLGVVAYGALTEFRGVGVLTIAIAVGLAAIGEVLETWVGFRYAKRYGGSSRAGWGAIIGGLVGAMAGVPVPVVGSVIGAFLGSFVGAAIFEYTLSRKTGVAIGAGWGAVWGRAAAGAIKIGLGLVITIVAVVAALSPR
jgi:uncharacterized protein